MTALAYDGTPGGPRPTRSFQENDILDGRWKIVRFLGEGGFTVVYQVADLASGQPNETLALRLYGKQDFWREVAALRAVDHPNIQRMRDHGPIAGFMGVWCDYVDGIPLQRYLDCPDSLRLSLDEIRDIGSQLLDALAHLHVTPVSLPVPTGGPASEARPTIGIVHRDVSLQNLIYNADSDHHLTLIDFNVAIPAGAGRLTVRGNPPYQPPDLGDRWSPSVDLFAAGVVLYWLLTGRHPYEDAQPVLNHKPIDPVRFNPVFSERPRLAAFLRKACAPSAAGRYPTAVVMKMDWERSWGLELDARAAWKAQVAEMRTALRELGSSEDVGALLEEQLIDRLFDAELLGDDSRERAKSVRQHVYNELGDDDWIIDQCQNISDDIGQRLESRKHHDVA